MIIERSIAITIQKVSSLPIKIERKSKNNIIKNISIYQ